MVFIMFKRWRKRDFRKRFRYWLAHVIWYQLSFVRCWWRQKDLFLSFIRVIATLSRRNNSIEFIQLQWRSKTFPNAMVIATNDRDY